MSQYYRNLSEQSNIDSLTTELENTIVSVDAAYNSFSDALIAAVDLLPRPRYAELESIYRRLHDIRKDLEAFPIEEEV